MEVIIYTKPNCQYSAQVKAHLNKRGVEYTERDITKDRKYWDELFNHFGLRATPLLIINGKQLIGFHPEEIDEALKVV